MDDAQKAVLIDALRGQRIDFLTVAQYTVSLTTDSGVVLGLEGTFRLVTDAGKTQGSAQRVETAAPLVTLVGARVLGACFLDGDDLEVRFASGAVLLCLRGDGYEAYSITLQGGEVFVF